jgi:hypothetical protein
MGGDVVEASGLVAALGEHGQCRVEDGLAALGGAVGAAGRGGSRTVRCGPASGRLRGRRFSASLPGLAPLAGCFRRPLCSGSPHDT